MSVVMAGLAERMMQQWQSQIQQAGSHQAEIELSSEFSELTSDVIAQTAFGSSYKQGKKVFSAQKELQALAFTAQKDVPSAVGSRTAWSLGEVISGRSFPHTVQCVKATARTCDLSVHRQQALPLAPDHSF